MNNHPPVRVVVAVVVVVAAALLLLLPVAVLFLLFPQSPHYIPIYLLLLASAAAVAAAFLALFVVFKLELLPLFLLRSVLVVAEIQPHIGSPFTGLACILAGAAFHCCRERALEEEEKCGSFSVLLFGGGLGRRRRSLDLGLRGGSLRSPPRPWTTGTVRRRRRARLRRRPRRRLPLRPRRRRRLCQRVARARLVPGRRR